MTANRNLKRKVRARAARTGESYTSALRHLSPTPPGDPLPSTKGIRLAVAQSTVAGDPRDPAELRATGQALRRLMREAHEAGARLVHFPEGATCSPDKRVMSIDGPDEVGPSDWDRVEWDVLRQELQQIATLARELSLWTVVGAVHRLTPPHRPHNSLYVISDRGEVVTRYDERMLSNTKLSFMYTPGATPVTFEVDGVRFGCLLGMEVHFPELFLEYERLDVDGVLFSTTGSPDPGSLGVFATEAQANAGTYAYWVGFAATTHDSVNAPSGVVSPQAQWVARCPFDGNPGLAVVDLDDGAENLARPWRRTARDGIYAPHIIRDDPRSEARGAF
jgi:predicted amidohydrolase